MTPIKHRFPFRLGTTSFIFPTDYITNVQHIGSWMDEVELLFFESLPESLPSRTEINRLAILSTELNVTYNVHLPLDLNLVNTDKAAQKAAICRLSDIIGFVEPLNPTTLTLHLECVLSDKNKNIISSWQQRARDAVHTLCEYHPVSPHLISIETLDYPPELLIPIVDDLGLSVCIDVGHLIRYGYDLQKTLDRFMPRISIIHLHGVKDGKDHEAITHFHEHIWNRLLPFLESFAGSVSIEVFSMERLEPSIIELERRMRQKVKFK